MVVEITTSYFDNLETVYEVLSRLCDIKDWLQLSAFVCVVDHGHEGLMETQGAIRWPSHNDGRFALVVYAL